MFAIDKPCFWLKSTCNGSKTPASYAARWRLRDHPREKSCALSFRFHNLFQWTAHVQKKKTRDDHSGSTLPAWLVRKMPLLCCTILGGRNPLKETVVQGGEQWPMGIEGVRNLKKVKAHSSEPALITFLAVREGLSLMHQAVFIQILPSGFSMLLSLPAWCCIGQGRDGSVSPPARIIWSWAPKFWNTFRLRKLR